MCWQWVSSLSLFEWYFTICPTSYNRKYVLSTLLNKTLPSVGMVGCEAVTSWSLGLAGASTLM